MQSALIPVSFAWSLDCPNVYEVSGLPVYYLCAQHFLKSFDLGLFSTPPSLLSPTITHDKVSRTVPVLTALQQHAIRSFLLTLPSCGPTFRQDILGRKGKSLTIVLLIVRAGGGPRGHCQHIVSADTKIKRSSVNRRPKTPLWCAPMPLLRPPDLEKTSQTALFLPHSLRTEKLTSPVSSLEKGNSESVPLVLSNSTILQSSTCNTASPAYRSTASRFC